MVPDVGELMLASLPVGNKFVLSDSDMKWYEVEKRKESERRRYIILYNIILINVVKLKLLTRWLGEKYDGIRSCWNPRRKKLYPFFTFLFNIHMS